MFPREESLDGRVAAIQALFSGEHQTEPDSAPTAEKTYINDIPDIPGMMLYLVNCFV